MASSSSPKSDSPNSNNFENSFLSYYLVFHITSIGLSESSALEDKKLLFDAAATFYCRALSRGAENIPETSKIEGASEAFNRVETWLTKWRNQVLMHEFCVQEDFCWDQILTMTASSSTNMIWRVLTVLMSD
jgi:hypothetical protein